MDKMRMESVDITDQNIEKIGALFPNVITETKDKNGKFTKAINFELLKQELSKNIIDGDEAYEFTWVGKKAAIIEANRPIRKTLRPCKEESVKWDTTENLYIEGDNLEVLKLLQESYLGKVKMIYIDPPYNTGNDFIYEDDFRQSKERYDEDSGAVDENGDRMFKNTASNARFHSDWCSMIYRRLMLARSLLSDDGVIFISIDDNEIDNLQKICNEIFGEENFINIFMWLHGKGKKDTWSRSLAQYIIAYAKNKKTLHSWSDETYTNYAFSNPDNDPKGKWFSGSLSFSEERSNPNHPNYYTITSPTGVAWTRQWQVTKEEMDELINQKDISWGDPVKCDGVPRRKIRPSTIDVIPSNIFENVGTTRGAAKDLERLMESNCFDYPKPIGLIEQIIKITQLGKDSIILDFFSGSATTAHAVMKLNAEDGGNRKYIMVQLPEKCSADSDAYKAGYKNICEIGKERIRRAAKKIHEEHPDAKFDDGFRVLKVDDSNMTDVYYSADSYDQDMLSQLESNIKPDRTDLDLLFGCLLEWGLPLSMPYTSENIEGCKVNTYNDGDLIACFDENIPEGVIKEIAKRKPLRAVFRDSGFKGSPEKINVGETFQIISPDTRVKII